MNFKEFANPPITYSSTVYFENLEEFKDQTKKKYTYGRHGNIVKEHLCQFISELEGGDYTELYSSGLQAITACLSAITSSGDTILASDNIYEPTKSFLNYLSKKLNIRVVYKAIYNNDVVKSLDFRQYQIVYLEPVGSMTLDVCDLRYILSQCQMHDATSLVDNTWSAGLSCKPLQLGADYCIHSCTKFMSGGSDIFMGSVTCKQHNQAPLAQYSTIMGNYVDQNPIYALCQRVESLKVRYKEQNSQCLQMIQSLRQQCPELALIYPEFDTNFTDQNGYNTGLPGSLFSFLLPRSAVNERRIFEQLAHLKIGYSWGGSKPVLVYTDMQSRRLAQPQGLVFRVSVGLDPDNNALFEQQLLSLIKEAIESSDV